MTNTIEYADNAELLKHNIGVYENIRLGLDADSYCECEKAPMRKRVIDLKAALAKLESGSHLEVPTCSLCNMDATHDTTGRGDSNEPSCNNCCGGCGERGCGFELED